MQLFRNKFKIKKKKKIDKNSCISRQVCISKAMCRVKTGTYCTNYSEFNRQVSLTSAIGKILEKII